MTSQKTKELWEEQERLRQKELTYRITIGQAVGATLFLLFFVVHLYMAFWYDCVFKEGTVSSMINGLLFKKKKV